VFGFFAGLAADVMPPTGHFAGELAFAYTVVGYLAGMLDAGEESSVLTIIGVVAGASVAVVLLFAMLGDLLGNAHITGGATLHALAGTVVYDVVLAPFVVPLISAAARRLEPVGPR
jgi:cell shape-determining protein MreD